MTLRCQIIGVFGTILALALVIELVRRRKLRTGYSLLWLFTGVLALGLVLSQDVVRILAQLTGIRAPASLLFTAGILFTLLILLGNSITLTTLWHQNKELAQHQALLEWKVRQLQACVGAFPSCPSATTESSPAQIVEDRPLESR